MARDLDARYQSVEEMLADLQALRSDLQGQPASHGRARKGPGRKTVIAALAAGVVLLAAAAIAIIPGLLQSPGSAGDGAAVDHRTMVVVLPFENLGPPEDEYFANGTTDAITARLASLGGLGVVSRQSAMQYRNSTKPIRQIGEELGVAFVLEGTVQRERPGDPTSRVRVIPQLIRVSDDTNVWAEIYDREMAQVFRVQSEIAENVAAQMGVTLLDPERRAGQMRPTENLAAYENYLRGMDFLFVPAVSDVELSVSLFQKAVALDPRFAEAWAFLAVAHHRLYWVFERPGELAFVKQAAERARDLAPDIPETQLALGYVAYAQRDFSRALRRFERADSLRPTGETAQAIGFTLRRLGRWEEVLEYGEETRRLMPRSANVHLDILGTTKACLRRFDEAIQDADHSIRLSPRLPDGYLLKAGSLLKKGDIGAAKEAILEMERRITLSDVAEYQVAGGLTVWLTAPFFRLFPETFTKVYDAFEAGPIERYRSIQPAAVAAAHLVRAFIYEGRADAQAARASFDSARAQFERIIRSNPMSAYVPVYQSDLGLACAGLGRKEEAMRIGEEAVRMIPISKDAVVGAALIGNLAEIYLRCGEHEAAIDQITTWLSVPSDMAIGLLRVDPLWAPLRENPGFCRLGDRE